MASASGRPGAQADHGLACFVALGLFVYNLLAVESGKGSTDRWDRSDLFSVGNKIARYALVIFVLVLGLCFQHLAIPSMPA
ncbi:MAG: hypothetical protein U0798_16415 [Gemmataceae bacterium]